jgi:Mg2+/Co2+ transporter CorC/osmotically-inducible protein OsmY/sporulation protein YlmC with PRC-barrel domain
MLYRLVAQLQPPPDAQTVNLLLQAAARVGAIPRPVGDYLQAALQLPELRLHDVMVPRVDVVAISEQSSVVDAARRMAESGRKRLPVYRDTIDQPVGVVHAVDLAGALASTPADDLPNAGALARPALTLPESLALVEAVQAMRSQAAHLVLVTDNIGGFAGLVTLEDVLEQLVGPIPDEYADEGRDAIRVVDNGVAIVGAAAGLHEIERALDVRLPRGSFASIGGLVYDHLKRVPRTGDTVELPGVQIKVLSVDRSRLRELEIRTVAALAEAPRLLDVGIGKEVVCGADVVGRVEHLVGDPKSARVKEFVVRLQNHSVVVPMDLVERTDEGVVYLTAAGCSFERFPVYAPRSVALGTTVTSLDGPVGTVRHVVVDRATGAVTHIVVRTSWLLVPRDIVVPLTWARSITPESIELAARRDELLELPEFHSDDEIRSGILRRLAQDARFDGVDRYTLTVEVQGGAVRLGGRVRTAELKRAAEELAANVPGVVSVTNQAIADDELAISLEHALRAAGVQVEDLEVSVLLGQVKLRGHTLTPDDSRRAEQLVRGFPGVQSVVNQLAVEQPHVVG